MFSWQLIKEVLIAVYQHLNIKSQFNLFGLLKKIYAQMVRGLANYAQKFHLYASLAAPDPSFTL